MTRPQIEKIADMLGGIKVLGSNVKTHEDLMRIMRSGFPYSSLETFMVNLGLSREEISRAAVLPLRTLSRRKQDNRLHADESDRIYRLARVAVHAEQALGSLEKAAQWLHRPNRSLGGEIPLYLLDNDIGAQYVDDVLSRIEHGVIG